MSGLVGGAIPGGNVESRDPETVRDSGRDHLDRGVPTVYSTGPMKKRDELYVRFDGEYVAALA